MAKRKKKSTEKIKMEAPDAPFNNPFAQLAGDVGRDLGLPEPEPEPEIPSRVVTTFSDLPVWVARKIVLQRENKGRGGKTVTRIKNLGLQTPGLEMLAKELKHALGCGASVDNEDILLQGAQSERAAQWLKGQGAANVVIGN